MPLGGVRSSPLPRPRNERRESRLRRSSWVRKSAESSSWPARTVATPLFLIQRLEVLLHLTLEVARHLLPRDGLFHHLPVLPEHAHVLQTRRHLGAAPHHLGVDALPPPGARLALDSHVARAAAEPRGGVALRRPALAAPGQEALALRKVALVPRPAGLPAALVAALAAAALALPPALQPLAVAAALFHRAHLVERALHRFHRLVGLPAPGRGLGLRSCTAVRCAWSRRVACLRSPCWAWPLRSTAAFSSSSSRETEKLGRRPWGSGIGGAAASTSPSSSGTGTSRASRGIRRAMMRRAPSCPARVGASRTSASTIAGPSERSAHSHAVPMRSSSP